MGFHDLGNLGSADVTSKKLTVSLKGMTWEQFSKRFTVQIGDLQKGTISILQAAIKNGNDQKLKKEADELDNFFSKIEDMIASGVPMDQEDVEEQPEIEKMKGEGLEKNELPTGRVTATYDRKTGLKEGDVTLKDGSKEGLLVPLVIQETVGSHYDHTGKEIEDRTLAGVFRIKNPSDKDRLWDIDVTLKNIKDTSIDGEKISMQELEPGADQEAEYEITKKDLPQHLEVKEFISAINDPDTESYALKVGEDQQIYFKITVKNVSEVQLTNIELTKAINAGFSNVQVSGNNASQQDDNLVWKVESLEAGAEVALEFRLTARVDDMSVKVQSGDIKVNYSAASSLSGIDIEKFDAYSNNRFYISLEELEEEPDKFNCQLVFQNTSDFFERLVNADVYDPNDDKKKFVDVAPEEIPELPSGAQWASVVWQYTTPEPQTEPHFRKKCEFFVIADHQISTKGSIAIDQVEMAVASIEGVLKYDVTQLASFRDTTFHVTHKVTNTGAALLNELSFQEIIPTHFAAPDRKEMKLTVTRDGVEDEVDVPKDAITIDPDDQEDKPAHTVKLALKDLIENDAVNGFKPNDTFTLTYPITAVKPDATVVYSCDVLYQANTLPAGKPLEVHIVGEQTIPVMHVRRKYDKGKEIKNLAGEGAYEITLFLTNTGQFNLENITVMDKVPDNFQYTNMTIEPAITDLEGEDILTWKVELLEPGQNWEVKFNINGQGEFKPKEAQFAL